MQIKTRPVVRCQICYCECSGVGARFHKRDTGHNLWELLLPVEKGVVEPMPRIDPLCLANTQEGALDSKVASYYGKEEGEALNDV